MRPWQSAWLVLVIWAFPPYVPAFAANDATQIVERKQEQDSRVKDELKRHQGTWVVISSIYDGQQADPKLVRSIKRIVNDDRVVWERDGKRFAGTRFELDPTRAPNTIDVILDGGPNRGEHVLGIYKVENDTLTICMAAPGQPRPRSLQAEKGSQCTLRTYRRESPGAR
jgi:uncharacterized protein (TIGR03067 family)